LKLKTFQNQLRRVLLRSELLAKARILEGFAYSTPERNRQIFTPGHKATYEYIFKFMSDLGYDVEYNEFFAETSSGSLTVDGVKIPAQPMTFTPSGKPSGKIVKVANIGCDAVSTFTSDC
jgi:carboxypeptidase Q